MLTMAKVDYIKELREKEGESIAGIAFRCNVSWSTAKKYADSPVDFAERPKRKRARTVMNGFEEYVEAWLQEDQQKRRKHRRTAKAIYKALCSVGYRGSDRTVRDFVQEKRQELRVRSEAMVEQFVRLEHPCGEAQVDFGEFLAVNPTTRSEEILYHLVMAFPHSNSRFARALPAQNRECLFFGLLDMFREIGGVPPYILFDNLTPVVKRIVSRTERSFTDMFLDFQRRFGFEYIFAAPGAANEKGCVENAVGYIRRNFLVPPLMVSDFGETNTTLQEQLRIDRESLHYSKQVPIVELWKDDKACLLPLGNTSYEPVSSRQLRVNKYGEITLDTERYHLPTGHHRQQVFVQIAWDQIRVYDVHCDKLISELPRNYVHKTEAIDWKATLTIYANKPRAIEQASHLKALPDVIKNFLLDEDLSERRQRIRALIALFEDHNLDTVTATVSAGLARSTTELASLRMIADVLTASASQPPLAEGWTPVSTTNWTPNLSAYDILTPGGSCDE